MGANQTKSSTSANKKVSDITDLPPSRSQLKHGILLDGLRGSGKSTVALSLNLPKHRVLEPDVRFLTSPQIYASRPWSHPNRPYVSNADEDVWRRGGRGAYAAVWNLMSHNTRATIFVVDSTDRERMSISKEAELPLEFVAGYDTRSAKEKAEILQTLEKRMTAKSRLQTLISETSDRYRRKPLLVLATKQDAAGAMSVEEICDALELRSVIGLDWRIAGIDADPDCAELHEAIDWLNYVIEYPSNLNKVGDRDSSDKEAWQSFKDELHYLDVEYRSRRLERGDVLLAPPLFNTDGTLFQVTEEQTKEFVISPLTAENPQDIVAQYEKKKESVQNYHEADGSIKPEYANVLRPYLTLIPNLQLKAVTSKVNSTPLSKPATKQVTPRVAEVDDLILPLPEDAREYSFSTALSLPLASSSNSSSPRGSRQEGIDFLTETENHTPEISRPSLPGMIDEDVTSNQEVGLNKDEVESVNREKQMLPVKRKLLSIHGKTLYGAIAHAFTPLPPRSQIPLAPTQKRKKHWYSLKKKEFDMPGYEERDVHKLYGRFAYTYKQWLGLLASEESE